MPGIGMGGHPVIAVDVGGTTIKAAHVDGDGVIHVLPPEPTPLGADAVITVVATIIERLRAAAPTAAAVGVVVPGIVDAERGMAVLSENLHWKDVPMRDRLERATGMPVALDHDVRAAARAERHATGDRDLAVLVIGTGIAAGLVVDGHLLDAGGTAGEIGHSIVVPGGAACVCGSRGCLEAVASAAAIARIYSARSGTVVDGAAAVLTLAQAGDRYAQQTWDEAIEALAVAVRQLVAVVGSRTVAIAGGLSLAGEALLAPLRERVAATLTLQAPPQLRVAHVGADGGLFGAIDIARTLVASSAASTDATGRA